METNVNNTTAPQHDAKLPVSSSISVTANVPKQFAEAVKELHKGYNCELKQYNDYKNDWITVEVQGKKSDIERLNKECEQIAYRDVL